MNNGQGEPRLADILAVAKEIGIAESEAKKIIDELVQVCGSNKMMKYKLK